LQESPRLTRSALLIPDLRYLVGDCEIARVTDARSRVPAAGGCILPAGYQQRLPEQTAGQRSRSGSPRTLAEWQSMLPYSWLTIDNLRLSPWEKWQGGW
jgi:hypothetical protein